MSAARALSAQVYRMATTLDRITIIKALITRASARIDRSPETCTGPLTGAGHHICSRQVTQMASSR